MNVTVDVPEPGAAKEAGLNVAVTPAGTLLALKDTGALNPPVTALVTEKVLLPGTQTAAGAGGVESVKL